jgi:hypothetical protein
MLKDEELAAALLAGLKMEVMMFDYYDWILPKIKGAAAKQEIAKIRLQELNHAGVANGILREIVMSPAVFSTSMSQTGFEQSKIILPHLTPIDIRDMTLPQALKSCYTMERDYEGAYRKIFSDVRDAAAKAQLMVLVMESGAHAQSISRILKAIGEEAPE